MITEPIINTKTILMNSESDKKMIAVTHSGDFHTDDIFASATLRMVYKNISIIRSRDPEQINSADIVFDVGQVYDPEKKRFDHHQKGGAGQRENSVPYASFGLVWKEYGEMLCGGKDIAQILDTRLVSPIDAVDNGIDICSPKIPHVFPYNVQQIFSIFTPNWDENTDRDVVFLMLSDWAHKILLREIECAKSYNNAKSKAFDLYQKADDKRILVLDDPYPMPLFQEFEDVIYVVYQGSLPDDWRAKAMRSGIDCFDVRKPFPLSWAGKEGAGLQAETGVSTATFAHQKQFLVGATTKEGAIELAKKALNA